VCYERWENWSASNCPPGSSLGALPSHPKIVWYPVDVNVVSQSPLIWRLGRFPLGAAPGWKIPGTQYTRLGEISRNRCSVCRLQWRCDRSKSWVSRGLPGKTIPWTHSDLNKSHCLGASVGLKPQFSALTRGLHFQAILALPQVGVPLASFLTPPRFKSSRALARSGAMALCRRCSENDACRWRAPRRTCSRPSRQIFHDESTMARLPK